MARKVSRTRLYLVKLELPFNACVEDGRAYVEKAVKSWYRSLAFLEDPEPMFGMDPNTITVRNHYKPNRKRQPSHQARRDWK